MQIQNISRTRTCLISFISLKSIDFEFINEELMKIANVAQTDKRDKRKEGKRERKWKQWWGKK